MFKRNFFLLNNLKIRSHTNKTITILLIMLLLTNYQIIVNNQINFLLNVDSNGEEFKMISYNNVSQLQLIWWRTFGGIHNDEGYKVQITNDGGYIIVGSKEFFYQNDVSEEFYSYSMIWLIKTDNQGIEQWNKIIDIPNDSKGYCIQQTIDDGYIIVGYTYSNDFNGNDILLIKIDRNGNKLWDKTFGGRNEDAGYSIQISKDNGFIILGQSISFDKEDSDIWLIKTDNLGNERWNKTININGNISGISIQTISDGGYIILGNKVLERSYIDGNTDIILIKIDDQGVEQWNKTFGGNSDDWGSFVQQTKDKGYIIIGNTMSYSTFDMNIWIIKTDEHGIEQWNKTYARKSSSSGNSIEQTSDDGFIILGSSYSSNFSNDIWLIKTDKIGNEEWSMVLGTENMDEIGYFVQQISDFGYIILGTSESENFDTDILLIKVDKTITDNMKNNKFFNKIFPIIILITIITIVIYIIFIKIRRKN